MFDRIIALVVAATTAISGGVTNARDSVVDTYQRIVNSAPAGDFDKALADVDAAAVATFVNSLDVDFTTLVRQQSLIDAQFAELSSKLPDPTNFLGNTSTKHGEIAEFFDVALHNAERIANGLEPDAAMSPDRTGPVDYTIGGKNFQSKFHNSPRATLNAVMNNINPDIDFYAIPKDQFEFLQKIRNSPKLATETFEYQGNRYRLATVEKMRDQLAELDSQGKKLTPSKVTHAEVQLDAAPATLKAKRAEIRLGAINAKQLGTGAALAGGVSAAIAGGFSIYDKVSEGKSIENFTAADWADVGLDAAPSGLVGAGTYAGAVVAGAAFSIPMPIAAAIVASIIQISILATQYYAGNITVQQLLSQALESSIGALLIGAGALAGAAALTAVGVPVIVGSIIPTIAAAAIVSIVPLYVVTDWIAEQTEAFVRDFSNRLGELTAATSTGVSNVAQVTQTALRTAYGRAKSSVADATAFAAARVSINR